MAQQFGAAEMPTVDATASADATWDIESGDRRDGYAVGLTVGYEIDLWGRIASQADAAEFDAAARAADVQTAALTIVAQTVRTWWQWAAALDRVALLESQRQTNIDTLTAIRGRFGTGQSSAADFYRQQQFIAGTEASLAQAQAQAATTAHALAVLVGLPPGQLPAHWRPFGRGAS